MVSTDDPRNLIPDKGVSLILEDPDLLNGPEACEGLLQQVLAQPVGDAAAVDGAVGGAALVVDLVEGEWLGVGCKKGNDQREQTRSFLGFLLRTED